MLERPPQSHARGDLGQLNILPGSRFSEFRACSKGETSSGFMTINYEDHDSKLRLLVTFIRDDPPVIHPNTSRTAPGSIQHPLHPTHRQPNPEDRIDDVEIDHGSFKVETLNLRRRRNIL